MSVADVCSRHQAKPLFEFVAAVNELRFQDCPDYEKLRQMLKEAKLATYNKEIDDKYFDWTA